MIDLYQKIFLYYKVDFYFKSEIEIDAVISQSRRGEFSCLNYNLIALNVKPSTKSCMSKKHSPHLKRFCSWISR